jgi:hypothetical protein
MIRAGTPGAGDVKGLLDDGGQLGGGRHRIAVFGNRQSDAGDIDLLEGVLPDEGVAT